MSQWQKEGCGSCSGVATPARFEVSTYHIFNHLSPPPLHHPHSLRYIHQPLTLDLLTKEASSTEDPTPTGTVPAEECKGSHLLWDHPAGLSPRGVPADMQALRVTMLTDFAPSQSPQRGLSAWTQLSLRSYVHSRCSCDSTDMAWAEPRQLLQDTLLTSR